MHIRTAVVLATGVAGLLISAATAQAGTLTAYPSHLSLSAQVGTTTEATLTITNTGPRDLAITGASMVWKPYFTPNNQTQLSAFSFGGCGERILAQGESCVYTIIFQPGVYDWPSPNPGTVFHARLIVDTSMGRETVRITATAT